MKQWKPAREMFHKCWRPCLECVWMKSWMAQGYLGIGSAESRFKRHYLSLGQGPLAGPRVGSSICFLSLTLQSCPSHHFTHSWGRPPKNSRMLAFKTAYGFQKDNQLKMMHALPTREKIRMKRRKSVTPTLMSPASPHFIFRGLDDITFWHLYEPLNCS